MRDEGLEQSRGLFCREIIACHATNLAGDVAQIQVSQLCAVALRSERRPAIQNAGADRPFLASLLPGRAVNPFFRHTLRKRFRTACRVLSAARLETLTIHTWPAHVYHSRTRRRQITSRGSGRGWALQREHHQRLSARCGGRRVDVRQSLWLTSYPLEQSSPLMDELVAIIDSAGTGTSPADRAMATA